MYFSSIFKKVYTLNVYNFDKRHASCIFNYFQLQPAAPPGLSVIAVKYNLCYGLIILLYNYLYIKNQLAFHTKKIFLNRCNGLSLLTSISMENYITLLQFRKLQLFANIRQKYNSISMAQNLNIKITTKKLSFFISYVLNCI